MSLIWAVSAVPLFAQLTNTDDPPEDEFYLMSPFTVKIENDRSYMTTNATSGTRLNESIKNIPMPLEVISLELIEDTGATDFREMLTYTSGVFTNDYVIGSGGNSAGANAASPNERSPSSNVNVGNRRTNSISIRGFQAPFQQRMGFRLGGYVGIKGSDGAGGGVTFGGVLDPVNIDRVEVVRGPGALLYGLGVLSGISNIIPKRPLNQFGGEVTFGAGSENFLRASIDLTGPVFKTESGRTPLSYRVMGAWQENEDWTDYYGESREYAAAQLDFAPFQKVRIFAEYQWAKTRFEGDGDQQIYDNLAGANNSEFRNKWNEQFSWGREDFNGLVDGPFNGIESRATGPDTWYERYENSFLANMEINLFENFFINLGGMIAKQDIEEFDVELSLFNNTKGALSVFNDFPEGTYLLVENEPTESGVNTDDYKGLTYWWSKSPSEATSKQARLELVYLLETDAIGFLGETEHKLLGGYQIIRDNADFPIGTENISQVYEREPGQTISINEDGDPVFIRDFYDFSPMRYNGEPLGRAGRSYYSVDHEYDGLYGVYHGKFFNKKLGIIAGLRHDEYQAWEEEWARESFNPDNVRTGTLYEGYNFPEPISVTTGTVAATWEVNKNFNIYALSAEGVLPNTGQRDGNGLSIEPEQTSSQEIGIKFDLFDSKVSGTISAYTITRENAVYGWSNAPVPGRWVGGRDPNQAGSIWNFNPERIENGSNILSYGVDLSYFGDPTEIGFFYDRRGDLRPPPASAYPDGIVAINKIGTLIPQWIVFLEYEKLDEAGFRDEIEAAFAEAGTRSRANGDIDPIYYRPADDLIAGYNPSTIHGANVTFEDEAKGFDFQIIARPMENLQFIFNYAYTERKVSDGFFLVDAVDYETGKNYGTEYDIWVRDLGRENFTDPTRPSTFTGGNVTGLSLFRGSKHSGSFWGKYVFDGGKLDGLGVGLGATYTSEIPTSFPIGGPTLSANQYRTPPVEENLIFNGLLYYSFKWNDADIRLSLNIYNILDRDTLEQEVEYYNDVTGEPEYRRSLVYLRPRSWRLSASIRF